MKIEKFREMHKDELEHKLQELQDNLFALKVKVQTKQVENSAQLATLRHDIARVKTLLREFALQPPAPSGAAVEKQQK